MINQIIERAWQKISPIIVTTLRFTEQWWGLLLVSAGFIAAALVFLIGISQSVWFDEAYSLTVARSSVHQIINLAAIDVHPPLYYLLLKVWNGLFGWNDCSYRALGAVIGGLTVIAAGLLSRKLFNVRAMIVTLPFITLAPFLLRYDFEIRMYALASLLGLIATYVLLKAVEAKQRHWQWWGLYAVIVALSMYNVYYSALLWIAHLVWLTYRTYRAKQPIMRQPWLAAYGIAIVLFIPWLPIFVGQLTNGALASISQPMTIENLVGILSFVFLYQSVGQLGAWGAIVIVVVGIVLARIALIAYKTSGKSERIRLALLVCYITVPIAVITLISLIHPFYVERYLAPIMVGGYLLLGAILTVAARRSPRFVCVTVIFLILVMIVGVFNLSQQGNFNYQRWQTPTTKAAAMAIGDCKDTEKVLAADPYVYIELSQYVRPSCTMYFYDPSAELKGGYAPLSKSSRQIKETNNVGIAQLIEYVYYGDPKLQPPSNYIVISQHEYGSLKIQTWLSN